MSLPGDICRCLGRRDWTAETDTCPKRAGCERYQAMQSGDCGAGVPWQMWLCKTLLFERILPVGKD
jgi:hypothetical protein